MTSLLIRITLASLVLVSSGLLLAGDWPEFRGPTGQGVSTAKDVPVEWDLETNIVWRTELAGDGWSSPVLSRGRLYLTAAVMPEGGTGKDRSLRTLCFDAATGEPVWDVEVFSQSDATAGRVHSKNSHASPTPITDGEHLWVHFGTHGTAQLDLAGKVVWRYTGAKYNQVHGNGGTPVLVDGRLVFSCDGGDEQFVVALDANSGEELWRRDRPERTGKPFSFSTPLVVEVAGRKQLVSPASNQVVAYDPVDGTELWVAQYSGYSVIPRPVFAHGLLFLATSYDRPNFLAIRPAAVEGKPADPVEAEIVWSADRGAPHTPSAVVVGDEVYAVSDRGIVTCWDARTGNVHWQQRVGGNFSASPIAVVGENGGHLHFTDEAGKTTVVAAGTEFDEVAVNDLGERTLASPAVDDGVLYVRTAKALYRIGEKP